MRPVGTARRRRVDHAACEHLRRHLAGRRSTTRIPPLDAWTCVEFLFDLDLELDRIKLFVNDAPIIDAPGFPTPTWDAVLVGMVRSPVGLHVFVDDVVVARARIGC